MVCERSPGQRCDQSFINYLKKGASGDAAIPIMEDAYNRFLL